LQQGLAVFIPMGRAINPITGTNWEGTGVIPDVQVEQESAMKTAQIAALKHVLADGDARGARRAVVEEARATLAELQR
ncbi:MAG: hypothetical protein M3380_18630, partial [Chloroflexota bacterium]|nr:hypothetical protein [Chloroflexota bacterium]